MNLSKFIRAVGFETAVVICGAIAAAVIVGESPQLKAWLRERWAGTKF